MQIEEIRNEISAVLTWAYFDNAGISPLPSYVKKNIEQHLNSRNLFGKSEIMKTDKNLLGKLKKEAAQLLRCRSSEIAVINNTAEGINIIAQGFPWRQGDNIITINTEYPSNVYPWLNLQKKGVEVKFVPERGGRVAIRDLEDAIDFRTKLLTISHVGFISGFRHNLYAIGKLCKKRNIHFIVDAAQSVGVIEIDVNEMRIDALSCCGWKWLLGPMGIGLLYCSESFQDKLELTYAGPNSMKNDADLLDYKFDLKDDLSRFEYSTKDMANINGFIAALEMANKIGINKIEKRVLGMTSYLRTELRRLGCEIFYDTGDENTFSGIVSIIMKKYNAEELYCKLLAKGVFCLHRYNYLRISPHFYNSENEIQRTIDELSTFV